MSEPVWYKTNNQLYTFALYSDQGEHQWLYHRKNKLKDASKA